MNKLAVEGWNDGTMECYDQPFIAIGIGNEDENHWNDGILECWNNENPWNKNCCMQCLRERRNINRGFKKLRVWQDAIALYVMACEIFTHFPFELKKTASNSIDAAHSISRNIAEGYCRRSLKEYLNYLNISLGSCGEFHSCYSSCIQANQITRDEYERLDQLHFKLENSLIQLIKSLRKKQVNKEWEDDFQF